MEVTSGNLGSTQVLQVQGQLDHSQANAFEAALAPHLVDCKPSGSPLVLDFSGVIYISSVALPMLLLAAKQVKAQQGRIASQRSRRPSPRCSRSAIATRCCRFIRMCRRLNLRLSRPWRRRP